MTSLHDAPVPAPVRPALPAEDPGPPVGRRSNIVEQLPWLVKAMRPKQWTKNLFCFVALIFAAQLGNPTAVLRSAAAFVLFCVLSGVVYLLNDLVDLEKDRAHPYKRRRPLASGALSPRVAMVAAVVLAVGAVAASFALNPLFSLVALGFLALNVLYSFVLKNLVLLDLFGIAGGFLLRALAGTVVIGVAMSPWLYLCTLLGALFIGLGKRRHELIVLEDRAASHRKILGEYTTEFLEELISIVSSAILITYALYTFFAEPVGVLQGNSHQRWMMGTIPFAIYGVFRYLYLVHLKSEGGAPEEILLKDLPLILDILLWAASMIVILYVLK
jgi:4-hydroxybenzoate polyprenyltransferase